MKRKSRLLLPILTFLTFGMVLSTVSINARSKDVSYSADAKTPQDGRYTIYLYNTNARIGTPYVYAWDNEGNNGAWPGKKMTYDSDRGVYYWTGTRDYTNCKFSNNGSDSQTGDLTNGAVIGSGKPVFTLYESGEMNGFWRSLYDTGTRIYFFADSTVQNLSKFRIQYTGPGPYTFNDNYPEPKLMSQIGSTGWYYYDVDSLASQIRIQRVDATSTSTIWNQTDVIDNISSYYTRPVIRGNGLSGSKITTETGYIQERVILKKDSDWEEELEFTWDSTNNYFYRDETFTAGQSVYIAGHWNVNQDSFTPLPYGSNISSYATKDGDNNIKITNAGKYRIVVGPNLWSYGDKSAVWGSGDGTDIIPYYDINASVTNGSLDKTKISVLKGTSYTVSGNVASFGDGQSITATPSSIAGYNIGSTATWNRSSGTVNSTLAFTATFSKSIINYTITYNGTDGATIPEPGNPATYTVETASFTLRNPSKTGYTFDGWTGEGIENPSKSVTISLGSTGNRTYTANWTIHSHNLSWVFNGGTPTGDYTRGTVNYGTSIVQPASITKTGYTFSSYSGYVEIMPDDDLTITALWTANVYTISLNNNGATSPGTTAIYEKYENGYYLNYSAGTCTSQMTTSSNPIPSLPTKTGYLFGGYYTGEGGTGTQYIDETGKLTSYAVTTHFVSNGSLYAKWYLPFEASFNIDVTDKIGVVIRVKQLLVDNGIDYITINQPVVTSIASETETITYTAPGGAGDDHWTVDVASNTVWMYIELNAAQLSEFLLIKAYDESDNQVGNDIRVTAAQILKAKADEAGAGTLKDLCYSMLGYGSYVQTVLGYKTGRLAWYVLDSDEISALQTSITGDAVTDVGSNGYIVNNVTNPQLSYGMESYISFRLSFECDDYSTANYYASVAAKAGDSFHNTLTTSITGDDHSCTIVVYGIRPDEIDQHFIVTVKSGGPCGTVVYQTQQCLSHNLYNVDNDARKSDPKVGPKYVEYSNVARAIQYYSDCVKAYL